MQYNGNISAIDWAMNTPGSRYGCSYGYDPLDRLTGSAFHARQGGGWQHDSSFDETGMTYDANGNLLTLSRYSAGGEKTDELAYHYESGSNRLDRIVYNHMNLPELIDFGEGEKIRYTWDASGARIGKTVMEGSNITDASQVNSGNFVYSLDGTLQYILTTQGRLVPDGPHFRFEYFMKDHLGNTRANYAPAAPGVPQVAEYQHYYPFGLQIEPLCYSSGADIPNNHLYNGKELQPHFGLQWYDYGARFYDPQVGRWHCMDPLTERSRSWSPYNYCMNNPIKFIDPDGMEIDDYFNRKGEFLYSTSEGNNIFIQDNGENKRLSEFNYSKSNAENREMLSNVATYYAQEAGFEGKVSTYDFNGTGPFAAIDPSTGQAKIVVDNNGNVNKEANFTGNMVSSYVHEEGHKGDPGAATAMGEIRAITKQVNDPSFAKEGNDPMATTESFRYAAGSYAAQNLNKGLANKTITSSQANGIINRLNASPLGKYCNIIYDNQSKSVISILLLQEIRVSGK